MIHAHLWTQTFGRPLTSWYTSCCVQSSGCDWLACSLALTIRIRWRRRNRVIRRPLFRLIDFAGLVVVVAPEAAVARRRGDGHGEEGQQALILDRAKTRNRIPPGRRGEAGSLVEILVLPLGIMLDRVIVRAFFRPACAAGTSNRLSERGG